MDYIRNEEQIKEKLRTLVPEKTYLHILRTVIKAMELCDQCGADKGIVYPAALLHDCAKKLTPTPEQATVLGSVMEYPPVVHAFLGELIAKEQFGITDPRILSCIRYHTTGRKNMTKEEQVVFLADAIEDGRDYPGVAEIRAKAEQSIAAGVLESLNRTVSYVSQSGNKLFPLTLEAKQYFEQEEKHE